MTVSEFRRTISEQLDKAIQGQQVTIERGGVVFTIVPSVKAVRAGDTK